MWAVPPPETKRRGRAWQYAALLLLALYCPSLAHGSSAATASWHAFASLPAAAEGLAAIRLPDGVILVLGGDAAMGGPTRLAARLSPNTTTWVRLPDAPVNLDTPAALALTAQSVMVVPPAFANGTLAQPSKALLLNTHSGAWQTLPSLPVPLLSPRLLRLTQTSVLAVGAVGAAIGALFDLRSQHWTVIGAPTPDLAGYSTALLPNQRLLLLATVAIGPGGRPIALRRAWSFSVAAGWRALASPPLTDDGAQAVVMTDTRVLFAGGRPMGENPAAPAPPALLYDPGDNRWFVAGTTGQAHRGGLLLALGGNHALLIGGHAANGSPSSSSLLFDGRCWHAADPLPGAWAGFTAVALDAGHVLLIGGDRPGPGAIRPVADTMIWSFDQA